MEATPTTMVYFNDPENSESGADNSEQLAEFRENVTEGDYLTVVYQTPSNGGSWHRAGGHIKNIRLWDGEFDDCHIEILDSDRDEAGDTAYLHISPTGNYYFSDNSDTETDWGIKKVAWTPKN